MVVQEVMGSTDDAGKLRGTSLVEFEDGFCHLVKWWETRGELRSLAIVRTRSSPVELTFVSVSLLRSRSTTEDQEGGRQAQHSSRLRSHAHGQLVQPRRT